MPPWQSAPLRCLAFLLGVAATLLPRGAETSAGKALGALILLLARKRRRVAEDNLRRCLPDLADEDREKLLRENFAHYGTTMVELMHMLSPLPGHYRRYAETACVLEGREHYTEAHAKGKGVIFVSSHVGNWEFLAAAGALQGIPITIVTRNIKPPWFKAKMEAARLSTGVRAAYQPRTMPTVLRALRKGDAVGFVIDQYALPPMGAKVRFFGYLVETLAAVGPLAARTGAAVLPASTYRDADGLLHTVIEPALDLGPDAKDPVKSTQMLAAMVERQVRAHPAQWLWGHRRFKNVDWSDRLA